MSGNYPQAEACLRPAGEGDADAIRRIVRQARIAPFGLDWRRFLVAEIGGQVVGTGQVKPHKDGTRELASIAVLPAWRRRGIASRLIDGLLAQESGEVYLICQDSLERFYHRFGFRTVLPQQHPPGIGRFYRLGKVLFDASEKIGLGRIDFLVMRRPPPEPE